ncbi:MAG: hypothetical protein WAW17_01900 [Rhodococcus sp. (in: high G+C Gram-positive bacteria)]|uniref:hypothetical protein n=1 Tax=Rhodococcus sp. TaxID=1831 RepID=UPI003BB08880
MVRPQVVAAVSVGYFLGRTHKMKLALMLAGAGATGRFPGSPGQLVQRGVKLVSSSPQFAEVSQSVRGDLMNAMRIAAVTAASQRIDSLSNRLQGTAEETVGGVGETVGGVGEGAGDVVGDLTGGLGLTGRSRSETDEGEDLDERTDDDSGEEEPPPHAEKTATRKRAPARRRVPESTGKARSRSKATRAESSTDSAPVRRTGR